MKTTNIIKKFETMEYNITITIKTPIKKTENKNITNTKKILVNAFYKKRFNRNNVDTKPYIMIQDIDNYHHDKNYEKNSKNSKLIIDEYFSRKNNYKEIPHVDEIYKFDKYNNSTIIGKKIECKIKPCVVTIIGINTLQVKTPSLKNKTNTPLLLMYWLKNSDIKIKELNESNGKEIIKKTIGALINEKKKILNELSNGIYINNENNNDGICFNVLLDENYIKSDISRFNNDIEVFLYTLCNKIHKGRSNPVKNLFTLFKSQKYNICSTSHGIYYFNVKKNIYDLYSSLEYIEYNDKIPIIIMVTNKRTILSFFEFKNGNITKINFKEPDFMMNYFKSIINEIISEIEKNEKPARKGVIPLINLNRFRAGFNIKLTRLTIKQIFINGDILSRFKIKNMNNMIGLIHSYAIFLLDDIEHVNKDKITNFDFIYSLAIEERSNKKRTLLTRYFFTILLRNDVRNFKIVSEKLKLVKIKKFNFNKKYIKKIDDYFKMYKFIIDNSIRIDTDNIFFTIDPDEINNISCHDTVNQKNNLLVESERAYGITKIKTDVLTDLNFYNINNIEEITEPEKIYNIIRKATIQFESKNDVIKFHNTFLSKNFVENVINILNKNNLMIKKIMVHKMGNCPVIIVFNDHTTVMIAPRVDD